MVELKEPSTGRGAAPEEAPEEAPEGIVSIVMPAYEERETIREIVSRVLAQPCVGELIVVDDGSTDGTRDILERLAASEPRILYEALPENRGKGAAVRRGIELASRDLVMIQDADLEYDPRDIPAVIAPLVDGLADVVYGSRFAPRECRRVLLFRHQLGNWALTFLSNLLTDLNLSDMETCYKAFRREVIQNLDLTCDRFGFEPEVTARLARSPAVFYEVPISYHGRGYEEGKKITWRDGVAALWFILKFNLSPSVARRVRRPWRDIDVMVRARRRRGELPEPGAETSPEGVPRAPVAGESAPPASRVQPRAPSQDVSESTRPS